MPHVEFFVAQAKLNLGWQIEQTQEVGNSSAFLADALAQSLLCEVILVDEFTEGEGNLNGVEVLALNILDESHLGELGVVSVAYIGWHAVELCDFCSTVASLSRNYLVLAIVELSQSERLNDAYLFD